MGLLDNYQIDIGALEDRLKRPLFGTPIEGEVAVVAAMNRGRLVEARRHLLEDPKVKEDFKGAVEEHLKRAETGGRARSWSVSGLEAEVWEHFNEQARLSGTSLSHVLAAAVRRDYDQAKRAKDVVESLGAEVKAFLTAALSVKKEVEEGVRRAGRLEDLVVRQGRLESLVQAVAARLGVMPARSGV